MKKNNYDPVRRIRISDEKYKHLDKIRKDNNFTWDDTIGHVLSFVGQKKEKKEKSKREIVGQNEGENEMMNIFYKINPTLNFGNRTERAAVTYLYEKLGKEKALSTANAAIAIHGVKFAPTITTPLQLKNKLSELVSFYKKNQANQIKEI